MGNWWRKASPIFYLKKIVLCFAAKFLCFCSSLSHNLSQSPSALSTQSCPQYSKPSWSKFVFIPPLTTLVSKTSWILKKISIRRHISPIYPCCHVLKTVIKKFLYLLTWFLAPGKFMLSLIIVHNDGCHLKLF